VLRIIKPGIGSTLGSGRALIYIIWIGHLFQVQRGSFLRMPQCRGTKDALTANCSINATKIRPSNAKFLKKAK
jgi:hypothetical protein